MTPIEQLLSTANTLSSALEKGGALTSTSRLIKQLAACLSIAVDAIESEIGVTDYPGSSQRALDNLNKRAENV